MPGNHAPDDLAGDGDVDGRCVSLYGLRVAGTGGAGPTRFGFPYEWDEDDIRGRSWPDCDVLISHAPPARTPLDVTAWGGLHAGSEAVRELAAGTREHWTATTVPAAESEE